MGRRSISRTLDIATKLIKIIRYPLNHNQWRYRLLEHLGRVRILETEMLQWKMQILITG